MDDDRCASVSSFYGCDDVALAANNVADALLFFTASKFHLVKRSQMKVCHS